MLTYIDGAVRGLVPLHSKECQDTFYPFFQTSHWSIARQMTIAKPSNTNQCSCSSFHSVYSQFGNATIQDESDCQKNIFTPPGESDALLGCEKPSSGTGGVVMQQSLCIYTLKKILPHFQIAIGLLRQGRADMNTFLWVSGGRSGFEGAR